MATENEAELEIAQANNKFSLNLYKVLSANEGNVFFSPISVHAVLSMVYQGAQETTAESFASTLQVPNACIAAEGYNAVMNRLNNISNVTLLMANKVYVMEGCELLEAFNTAVSKQFLSKVQLLNFEQSATAAATINCWVTEQTRNKINNIVTDEDFNGLTRVVLVNAIYFKGNWKYPFDEEKTKTEPFYLTTKIKSFLNPKNKFNVQMMHIKEYFGYKIDRDLDAQVLEMPYVNEDLKMIFVLPIKRDGICKLEKTLAACDLANVFKGLWTTVVNVALPRFKIETTIDLKGPLTQLGLGEIFSPDKADFSAMFNSGEKLFVSKVVQKAFIEVNEEGAEAAAATACFAVYCSSVPPPEIYFKADHPFIFYLVYQNIPLFLGKLTEI